MAWLGRHRAHPLRPAPSAAWQRSIALLLLVLGVGCNSTNSPSAVPDAGQDAEADAPTSDASADAPDAADFSALDPARCAPPLAEPETGFDPSYDLLTARSQRTKAFYALELLGEPAAASELAADATFLTLRTERLASIDAALSNCPTESACLVESIKWSEADITRGGEALTALASGSTQIAARASALRRSGHASLYASGSDQELLSGAWAQVMAALNAGLDGYASRLPPADLRALLTLHRAGAEQAPAFEPALAVLLAAIVADDRDEATRYEPLATGENQAVLAEIPSIDFESFPFATIVVPGRGPQDLTHPLDPDGQIRADQAAARYAARLAPIIALTGGHVHPDRTPYSEAVEMKRYLMQTHSVPESALLIDPHARHTTTNLRNLGRHYYRYGIPTDKPSLVTTDFFQSLYIAAAGADSIYGKRCLEELGFMPYRSITALSEFDNCWYPSRLALHADPRDLLDP